MDRSAHRPTSHLRRAAFRVALVATGSAALAASAGEWDGAADEPSAPAPTAAPRDAARATPPRRPRTRAAAPAAAALADAAPITQPTPRRVVRTVRLVDGVGRPVAGAKIDSASGPDQTTDYLGEAAFVGAEGAPSALTYDDGFGRQTVEVREEVTELPVATVDVVITTIDGFTGAPTANGGVTLKRDWAAEVERTDATATGALLSSARTEDRTMSLRVETGSTATHAPAGALAWHRPISITARRVRIDVPVFPLRTVTLRPVSEDGEDVSTVEFAGASLRGDRDAETWSGFPASASGRTADAVLVDVPRVPANFATFRLESPGDEASNTRLVGTSSPLALGAHWPDLCADVPVIRVGLGREGGRRNLTSGVGCRGARDTTPVKVVVRRRDGSPARHVRVSGWHVVTTSADGTATVAVAKGDRLIRAAAHGFLPSSAPVNVDDGPPGAVVEIVESAPRRVRIVVVDSDDRPVPSARVFATSTSYFAPVRTIAQMDGDTEIGTPRTDADGTLTLDVCDGTIRYDISLAGAATWVESDASEVRVTLGARPSAAR